MYIRRTKKHYNGKTYTNYLLVESVSTPKGPRQRTICSLGDLRARSRAEWLALAHQVEAALAGQASLPGAGDPELAAIVAAARRRSGVAATEPAPRRAELRPDDGLISIDPDRVSTEEHREAGPVHIGYQFWQRLGFDTILQNCGLPLGTRQLACAMVLNRLISPASEHAMPAWMARTALADLLGPEFTVPGEDALYRVMDRLHPHRAAIETALVARERSLFNLDTTIYLYDLTSTYFEGLAMANPKAKRGHSRDKRMDCKQVVVGLVVGREGLPICHEVFAGNTQDVTTLQAMLDRLAERAGLAPGATVVVDRGLASAANLALLKARQLHYIIASRQSERDRWLASFADEIAFTPVLRTPSPTNPGQNKSQVGVQMIRGDDHTDILCRSTERIAKDKAIRLKHEQRLIVDLDKLQQQISKGRLVQPKKISEAIGRLKERYPRVARYYDMDYDTETKTFTATKDDAKYQVAEQLDGTYLLNTDRTDLTPQEAWLIYSLLTRAEDAFRDMKTPLATRPIFHHYDYRVDTHIFLCVLAFHLLAVIEKTLRDRHDHRSWETVRELAKTHQISTVVLPTGTAATLRIRVPSTPEPDVVALYRLLAIPLRPVTPIRSWSDSLT